MYVQYTGGIYLIPVSLERNAPLSIEDMYKRGWEAPQGKQGVGVNLT